MVQNANTSDDLLHKLHAVLQSASKCVGRIANYSIALSHALRALHSNDLTVLEQNLVDISVEHESTTVNGTDSRKSFRDSTQAEDRINERGGIFSHGVHIELDLSDEFDSGAMKEAVIGIKGNGMANEVNSVFLQSVFLQHFLSRSVDLDTLVGLRVAFFEILNGLEEFLASSLLEETHEIGAEGFLGGDWHLEDLHATFAKEAGLFELKHVGTVDS